MDTSNMQSREGGGQIAGIAPTFAERLQGPEDSKVAALVVVLIAEDSRTQAMALRRLLEKHHCEVMAAENGAQAMARLIERRPTLVVTDVNMPEMDGYDLCRRIKNDPGLADLPVILLTALSAPKDVLKGIECGADSFVIKPYDEHYLISRIEHVLAHLPLQQKHGENERLTEITYDGAKYAIDAGRAQAVELLLSTYEVAMVKHRQLEDAQSQLLKRTEELSHALIQATEAHDRLKHAQMQLVHAEKLQTVGQLAAGISHEVKNPLGILRIGIDWLADSALCRDEQSSMILSEMSDAVERASLIIGDLLDFSSQNNLEIAETCINALIEKALRFVKHDLTTGKVRVVRRLADDLPAWLVDANRILQVFINLIVNACHAMPKGGVLTITTSKKQMDADDGDYKASGWAEPRYRAGDTVVNVEIQDTGTGISEEHMKKIFTAFFTTKPAGQGTGLGLSVTKQIIEMHRGILSIRNADEGGAIVAITFTSQSSDTKQPAIVPGP